MLDILELNNKKLVELRQIAKDLGIRRVESFKKQDLIYRILDEQAIQESERKKKPESSKKNDEAAKNEKRPRRGRPPKKVAEGHNADQKQPEAKREEPKREQPKKDEVKKVPQQPRNEKSEESKEKQHPAAQKEKAQQGGFTDKKNEVTKGAEQERVTRVSRMLLLRRISNPGMTNHVPSSSNPENSRVNGSKETNSRMHIRANIRISKINRRILMTRLSNLKELFLLPVFWRLCLMVTVF